MEGRRPVKTSIREQLNSLESSIARFKRSRYESHDNVERTGEPVLKRHRSAEISPRIHGDGEHHEAMGTIHTETGKIDTGMEKIGKKQGRIEEPEQEEGFDVQEDDVGRDSDAGLLIQSPGEGPYEPLMLWPEEGSSSSSEVVKVPASINSRLLEHQREGVKFLYKLYRNKCGGILGDDMGLGKTIQSIAFIAAILNKDSDIYESPYESSKPSKSPRKVVLILCPTSVIDNWQREFESWGSFSLGIFHGSQRDIIVAKVLKNRLDVVITSHDTFRIHGDSLQEIEWECVIVDEAHRLKNDKSKLYEACCSLRTKCRLGLTGTIMQNKLLDMYNVFQWASPGCLGTKDHFRSQYDEPIKQGQRISAPQTLVELAEIRRQKLLGILRKYSLRRTKDQTIGHLLRGKEDIVVFCAMSPLQKRVYTRLLQTPDFQCLVRKDEECSCGSMQVRSKCCFRTAPKGIIWRFLHRDNPDGCVSCPYCLVLPCLTKLQQVSNHLELLKPNPNDDEEKRKRDKKFASLVFGEDAASLGGVEPDENFLSLSDTQNCGKMLAVRNLLFKWTSQGDKVLLFSCSVRMLGILEKFLIRRGYSFCRLDGSTPMNARQAIVDEFNNSPSKQVFLISTRAGGLGLNLVSANRVVVFDPNWNPAQDLQAQDRSFRFGQKRHVTVFRLLAAGSLEELIYTRQIYKQQLFNLAVTGTHEKRYFEGVQDSKANKGELFGVSNLFRDLQDKVFTSDIIEQHEERLMKINVDDSSVHPKARKPSKAKIQESEQDEDEHGLSDLAELVKSQQVSDVQEMLTDAGVVYVHRNEEVVNIGARQEGVLGAEEESLTESVIHTERRNRTRNRKSKEARDANKSAKRRDTVRDGMDIATRTKSTDSKKPAKSADGISTEGTKAASKQELFTELAKFKGMSVKDFSGWMVTANQAEREELLSKFRAKV